MEMGVEKIKLHHLDTGNVVDFMFEMKPKEPITHFKIQEDGEIIQNFTECGFCRAIMHVQALYCGHCGKGRTH